MIFQPRYLILLITFFSLSILSTAHADVKQIQGKVNDVINVPAYTYAEVDTGNEKIWAAAPTTTIKKGDTIAFSTAMPMTDFYSDSIKRKFPLIYFVSNFSTGTDKITASSTPSPHAKTELVRQALKGIKRVDGGKIISEIYDEKDSLKGKTILVRGKVTRFAAEVMGENWLHIQDSSGFEDLTVTTSETVAIGDMVIIEGKLELDNDFGYGYVYPVMIKGAKVTKE